MVDSMNEFFKTRSLSQEIPSAKDEKSERAFPEGDIKTAKYRNYYDVDNTITTAQTSDPNDPDHPNYDRERVFVALERNAERVAVINDNPIGGATLFIIISHDGEAHWTRERPIYPQETKIYYNVYELRLRSPVASSPYRVTEYQILIP